MSANQPTGDYRNATRGEITWEDGVDPNSQVTTIDQIPMWTNYIRGTVKTIHPGYGFIQAAGMSGDTIFYLPSSNWDNKMLPVGTKVYFTKGQDPLKTRPCAFYVQAAGAGGDSQWAPRQPMGTTASSSGHDDRSSAAQEGPTDERPKSRSPAPSAVEEADATPTGASETQEGPNAGQHYTDNEEAEEMPHMPPLQSVSTTTAETLVHLPPAKDLAREESPARDPNRPQTVDEMNAYREERDEGLLLQAHIDLDVRS